MTDMTKPNLTLNTIEAYAIPSDWRAIGDSHAFVVSKDRSNQWTNHGRGWGTPGAFLVASAQSYWEWLVAFVPPGTTDSQLDSSCGITFGVNGVCHTYANRELLVANAASDVGRAPKNEYALFFFGKYGMGRPQLRKRLEDSYQRMTTRYNDPYGSLASVLARMDDYLEDELCAWKKMCEDVAKIPVDQILQRSPVGGKRIASERLQSYIDERESLYQDFLRGTYSESGLRAAVKAAIVKHTSSYLSWLVEIGYITSSESDYYLKNTRTFLDEYLSMVEAQAEFVAAGKVLPL